MIFKVPWCDVDLFTQLVDRTFVMCRETSLLWAKMSLQNEYVKIFYLYKNILLKILTPHTIIILTDFQ